MIYSYAGTRPLATRLADGDLFYHRNDITTTFGYDPAGNLLSLTHTNITGTVGSYSYQYDATGRRVGAVEAGRTITYTYDALYRLIEAQESTGDLYQYSYDAAGNRLSKIEPGEAVTATYDAANQILALNGQAASHDANGNLLDDGTYSYTYNDLDQLIAVTDGISQTLYGYNGDGDRLWQRSDGMTTTFTLDLNGALAQVLAQTPQAGSGGATYFVPGTGAQQTQNVWRYLHSDGLGSVRHVTGAAGQAVGQMRYTPFGETAEQSGATSLFGFTGEPQGGWNDLVYLRARYYNPALGRFLTQDSLIPNVSNGQALNAYAYVYNDPINLVDPSGNIPVPSLPRIDRSVLRNGIRRFAEKRLDAIDSWYSEPKGCSCNNQTWKAWFWPPVAGTATQVAWGVVSQPAAAYGTFVIEAQFEKTVTFTSWWRKIPGMQSRIANRIIPQSWGYTSKTVLGPWETWTSRTGWIDDIVAPGLNRSGTHYLSKNLRYSVDSQIKRANGITGAAGATLVAGLIDGAVQAISDIGQCFSRAERWYRAAIATGLGLLAGGAGALAFTFAAGASALAATPILAGLAVGLTASATIQYFGVKDSLFAAFPE